MEWIYGFLTLCVLAVVVAIWQGLLDNRKASELEDKIKNLPNFDAADVYVSSFNHAGVAIDRTRREFLLADKDGLRRFNVRSIMSCEVLEDDVQLACANRGSQLTGMAIGGALLGGVGAVIGGLSASQRNVSRVKSLVLRFTTDNFDNPVHDIVVVRSPSKKGMPRDGVMYPEHLKIAQRWHARTVAMMKAADG